MCVTFVMLANFVNSVKNRGLPPNRARILVSFGNGTQFRVRPFLAKPRTLCRKGTKLGGYESHPHPCHLLLRQTGHQAVGEIVPIFAVGNF